MTDPILTNKPWSFQHSCVIEKGSPDFNKMAATVMKGFFEKIQPKVVNYRNYKYFEKDRLRIDSFSELGQEI